MGGWFVGVRDWMMVAPFVRSALSSLSLPLSRFFIMRSGVSEMGPTNQLHLDHQSEDARQIGCHRHATATGVSNDFWDENQISSLTEYVESSGPYHLGETWPEMPLFEIEGWARRRRLADRNSAVAASPTHTFVILGRVGSYRDRLKGGSQVA